MIRLDAGRPDRLLFLFARVTLGAAFLSGIMSRFGLWGPDLGYGTFAHYVEYTAQVNAFMPTWSIPFLAWAATVLELAFGILLVFGVRTREVAHGSAALLVLFGTAMAISMGIKAPLDYSVYSAAAAALLLARGPAQRQVAIAAMPRAPTSSRGVPMPSRFSYAKVAPGVFDAMDALDKYLGSCAVEASLLDLIRLRVSQINGCAYCLDMHWKDLRAGKESEERLYSLEAWRECPYYTERERAALAWAEEVTLVSQRHIPDAMFDEVRGHFSEREVADLTLAVAAINAWNRLSIAARPIPGTYQPAGLA